MSQLHKNNRFSLVEKFGRFLPMACAVHCLATPLLFAVLPAAGISVFDNHLAEFIILAVGFGISLFFVLRNYFSTHKNHWLVAGLIFGFFLLSIAHLIHQPLVEKAALIIGAVLVYYVLRENEKLSTSCNAH